jgi:hypothetical protein
MDILPHHRGEFSMSEGKGKIAEPSPGSPRLMLRTRVLPMNNINWVVGHLAWQEQ